MNPRPPTRQQDQDALLDASLRSLFGELDAAALGLLRDQLEWVELAGGQALMRQGEVGDALYIAVSGRLRAYVRDEDGDGDGPGQGQQRLVREMARGQVIGEMALFTDEPRSATVLAIRDSVLVRLGKPAFQRLLASSPQVSMALTRQIIGRLQNLQKETQRAPWLACPVTMGLLPITAGVDAATLAAELAAQLRKFGQVQVVDAAAVDAALQQPGIAHSDADDVVSSRRIALWLDHVEAHADFLLLVGDSTPSAWSLRCSRHCDELLLLADARQPPVLHAIETELLMGRTPRTGAAEILLLLHPADAGMPSGTAAWLARRPVAEHLHLRRGHAGDIARLARIQARQAVGLVLAGGGARGLAHLGVWRALREHGTAIDVVGGTSIGAVMAAMVASDRPLDHVMAVARRAFAGNPTGDFNLLPLLSLIKGQRLRRIIDRAVVELTGADIDIEDLWKPYYCVVANVSQAREDVIRHGRLSKLMRASLSIPGALPPVAHGGDLLCDGGTFNNFPVDVMQGLRGVSNVIGVDLRVNKSHRIEADEVPGPWALARDRLRRARNRRWQLPGLAAYLMSVTVLYSSSRQRQAKALTQLYFNPPLERVGMLQWHRFEQIVERGHAHAQQVLTDAHAQQVLAAASAAVRVAA
jgi:NTE family protein